MVYKRNKGIYLIESLQAQGKRTFTLEEAQKILKMERPNIRMLLSRLKRQKRILALTRGLYALWHPSERRWGLHPLPVLDSLMRFKKTGYYIGLLSAADHHGAAHQKPQVLQVIVPKQLHLRNLSSLGIFFHVKRGFPGRGLEQGKTPAGYVFYSSPELTALDIVSFQPACGGFENVCLVIKDLIPQLDPGRLEETAKNYPVTACLQRLGYLLEYFEAPPKLIRILRETTRARSSVPVSLSPSHPKMGPIEERWKVIKNTPVRIEP